MAVGKDKFMRSATIAGLPLMIVKPSHYMPGLNT